MRDNALRGSVFLLDEEIGGGDEIEEGVDLLLALALAIPAKALLHAPRICAMA